MSGKLNYAVQQKPNHSGFVVIGAGLPRTGTLSTRAALGQLLDGACYHMVTVAEGHKVDLDFWNRAFDGDVTTNEWIEFLQGRGYRAGVDFPLSLFYRDLMSAFPDAKVLLTKRDPVSWYKSVKATICKGHHIQDEFAVRMYLRLLGRMKMFRTVRRSGTTVPPGFEAINKGLVEAVDAGEETAIAWYNHWLDTVRKTVPAERLLEFDVREGWEPLCRFLDVSVPENDFPRVNSTESMSGVMTAFRAASYFVVYGVPVLLGVGTYFCYSRWNK